MINELDSTITRLAYDAAAGALKARPDGLHAARRVRGQATAPPRSWSIPTGKLLYGSNRGHDSIAIFTIDGPTGALTAAGHQPTGGKTPRNFAIDPTGAFLLAANQDSDTIAVFRIDRASGRLASVGSPVRVPRPVCLRMMR